MKLGVFSLFLFAAFEVQSIYPNKGNYKLFGPSRESQAGNRENRLKFVRKLVRTAKHDIDFGEVVEKRNYPTDAAYYDRVWYVPSVEAGSGVGNDQEQQTEFGIGLSKRRRGQRGGRGQSGGQNKNGGNKKSGGGSVLIKGSGSGFGFKAEGEFKVKWGKK